MYNDITGIILSGGKSTRMGENKSLMKINGKTIIEHVNDLIQSLFSNVILISNNPDEYEFLGIKIYKDIFPGMGPLAGIHSGLKNSSTQKNFIISCDIPLMTPEMIKTIPSKTNAKFSVTLKIRITKNILRRTDPSTASSTPSRSDWVPNV